MKVTTFEGTPEEIKSLLKALEVDDEAPKGDKLASKGDQVSGYASVDFIRNFIKRRPLASSQKKIFLALYGAYPNTLKSNEMAKQLGYEPHQMAGFWGAFGRRKTNTEHAEFEGVIIEWNVPEQGEPWRAKLTENAKKAIELEKDRFPELPATGL